MLRFLPACLAALLLAVAPAASQQPGPAPRPNFAAHKPEPALQGPAKMPDFRGRDAAFADFRTRLNDAARGKANFSGHYVITQIGCGSGCNTAYVIDKATGAVSLFPRGGEEHPELGLQYNVRSSLVVASWRSRTDDKCWTEQFVLRNGTWDKLNASYKSGQACFE
jgi:hypothetical protein